MKMHEFYLQHTGISEKSQLQYLIWEFLQSKVSKHSKITYFVFPSYFEVSANLKILFFSSSG